MEIEIKKIKEISDILFQHLLSLKINKIEITEDLYWNWLDYDKKYNIDLEPNLTSDEISIGDLTEDLETLYSAIENEDERCSFLLTYLSEILTYIGWKIGK